MEYSHKGSLHELLHEKHSLELTWPIRLRLAEDTALGINWLHKQRPQIIHRDLKTANILVNRNLVGKLCDFGISQVFEGLDKNKGFFGSPIYSAPECLLQRPYDAKVDCFSYSYVLWELVTGKIPYEGLFQTFNQLVEAIVLRGYRASIPPSCPKLLSDLILRCWSPMAQDRPSFQEILDSNILRTGEVVGQEPWRTVSVSTEGSVEPALTQVMNGSSKLVDGSPVDNRSPQTVHSGIPSDQPQSPT